MTISSTTTKNSYSGNGSATSFNYTFFIPTNTDIEVIVSYSDLQQGHEGVVYKASNFISMGQTPMGLVLMVDGKQYHDRTIRNPKPYARTIKRRWEAKQSGKKDDDIYLQKTKPKNIYVYYLNKKHKVLYPNQDHQHFVQEYLKYFFYLLF